MVYQDESKKQYIGLFGKRVNNRWTATRAATHSATRTTDFLPRHNKGKKFNLKNHISVLFYEALCFLPRCGARVEGWVGATAHSKNKNQIGGANIGVRITIKTQLILGIKTSLPLPLMSGFVTVAAKHCNNLALSANGYNTHMGMCRLWLSCIVRKLQKLKLCEILHKK